MADDPSSFIFDGGISGQSTAAANPTLQNPSTVTQASLTPSSGNPNQVASAADAAQNGIGLLQIPAEELPYYMTLQLQTFSRPGWNDVAVVNTTSTIVLPFPENIRTTQSVDWEAKKVGMVGAAAMATASGNFSLNSLTTEGGLASIAGKAGITAAGANGGTIAGELSNAAQAIAGVAVNDFATMMLVGPKLREYSFSWHFAAQNVQESRDLQTLYKILMAAQAPGLGSGAASMFWNNPQAVQMNFWGPTGDLSSAFTKFKPAVMTNVSFNFNPHGVSFFAGTDAPTSVALSIEFYELVYWLNTDYSY